MDELKEIREALEVLLSWMPRGIGERGDASKAWDKGQHALAALSRLEAREAAPKTVPMAMIQDIQEDAALAEHGDRKTKAVEILALYGYTVEG